MRILLVEDHDITRRGIEFLVGGLCPLSEFDHAIDQGEALQLSHQNTYDLITMDGQLANESYGPDVVRLLRAAGCESPIIMWASDETDRKNGIQAGADAELPKPASIDQVEQVLRQLGLIK